MHIFRASRLSKWTSWRIIILLNSVYLYFDLPNTGLYFVNITANFRQYNIYTIILFFRTQSILAKNTEEYHQHQHQDHFLSFVLFFYNIFFFLVAPLFQFLFININFIYFLFFFRLLSTFFTFQTPWFSPFHDKIIKETGTFRLIHPK